MKLRNKKTGEVIDFSKGWGMYDARNYIILEHYGNPRREYATLAELNEEWEDYEPQEPLIKDEKIRKAVRAWAEALGIERASYSCTDGEFYSGDNCIRLGMVNRPEPIKSDTYTITELCGEEE